MSGSSRSRQSLALITLVAAGGGLMALGFDRPPAGFVGAGIQGGLAAFGADRTGPDRAALTAAMDPALTPAIALAAEIDAQLGLPAPASRSVERVTDTASGLVVSEVTDLDGSGTPIAVSRFDLAGRLVSSVRLGFITATGSPISAARAASAATTILARVRMAAPGTPAVTPRAAGGWLVRWVRIVATVPVPGDGIGVQLTGNGEFHAIVRTQHELAAAPAVRIDQAQVRLLVGARLDGWFAGSLRREAAISSLGLAWVAPNDTFGDAIPAGPPGVLRLAWIVRVTAKGSLADRFAGLELAFDAGQGTPLGGDLLE